jgi:hypothetical protein
MESAQRTDDESDTLVTVVADFLDAGTRDDARAFSATLLSDAWTLLEIVLDQARPAALPSDDPMIQALNSPKGRAIQALLSHVLRESRLADKESGSHADVWNLRKAAFDREVELCSDGNYEFATISAAHIVNLEYLDPEWVTVNASKIFALDAEATFVCAMAGFAYSSTTRRIYELLRDQGVFDRALRIELKGSETRKSLIERVMLAYLWGAERLEMPRLAYIVASGRIEDLEAASWFFWTMRNSGLDSEQRRKIIDFWDACVTWAKSQREIPGKLLASLGSLSFALDNVSGRNYELLLAAAPHIGMHTNVYGFFGELLRLVKQSPAEIANILDKVVDKYDPAYDYEDRLKALIGALAANGQRGMALSLCDRLRNVPGILALFGQLTRSAQ